MSGAWAYAGGALLAAAALPQAIRLVRERSARDFAWSFIGLNAIGIALLLARSIQIGEWAFASANALTLAFWALAGVVKASGGARGPSGARHAAEAGGAAAGAMSAAPARTPRA